MKNIKRIICFSLFAIILLSFSINTFAIPHYLLNKNDLYVTRSRAVSEVASVIDDYVNIDTRHVINRSNVKFDDVDIKTDNANMIEYAKRVGLIKGQGNGNFSPDSYITRQDYAIMIKRMFDILRTYGVSYVLPEMNGAPFEESENFAGNVNNFSFEDLKNVRDDAAEALYLSFKTGFLYPKHKTVNILSDTAKTLNYIAPEDYVTTAEVKDLKNILLKLPFDSFTKFR